MAEKTIKELADILGVSKDKVKYQLRKLKLRIIILKKKIGKLKNFKKLWKHNKNS